MQDLSLSEIAATLVVLTRLPDDQFQRLIQTATAWRHAKAGHRVTVEFDPFQPPLYQKARVQID